MMRDRLFGDLGFLCISSFILRALYATKRRDFGSTLTFTTNMAAPSSEEYVARTLS